MILWHFTRCGKFSKGLIVVRAVRRHRTGSIPAAGPYSDVYNFHSILKHIKIKILHIE